MSFTRDWQSKVYTFPNSVFKVKLDAEIKKIKKKLNKSKSKLNIEIKLDLKIKH